MTRTAISWTTRTRASSAERLDDRLPGWRGIAIADRALLAPEGRDVTINRFPMPWTSRRLTVVVLLLVALVAAVHVAVGTARVGAPGPVAHDRGIAGLTTTRSERVRAAGGPACFGAAARDPEAPCVNRQRSFTAIPTPYDAPLQPSEPCTPIRRASPPACAFGPPRRRAVSSVALMGDSHATHWRAALAFVAGVKRWHGVSITRNLCPFTLARTSEPRCAGWSRSALRWLAAHPEVHSLVVSANSGSGVVAAPGKDQRTTKIDGYVAAWEAVAPSVRDIFVLRDVPHSRSDTAECVTQAIARRRNPGIRCARPRIGALRADLESVAAERASARRRMRRVSSSSRRRRRTRTGCAGESRTRRAARGRRSRVRPGVRTAPPPARGC